MRRSGVRALRRARATVRVARSKKRLGYRPLSKSYLMGQVKVGTLLFERTSRLILLGRRRLIQRDFEVGGME